MNKNKVTALFEEANFIKGVGIKPVVIEKGFLKTTLVIEEKHLQQHNFIHAAVLAAIADHTAGGAATTLVRDDQEVLTIEFKINFLKPATGEHLFCESKVIRAGKTIIVAESDVYSDKSGRDSLLAKAIVTLTPVEASKLKK